MTRYDLDARILEHRCVAEDHYWMRLACPPIARQAKAGQFVHLQIRPGGSPLLRRPLTVYRRDGENIELLYQTVGTGTRLLSRARSGDALRLLGPLGNGFRIPVGARIAWIVGGGVGLASLMLLAEELVERHIETVVLAGATRASRLVAIEDLRSLGVEVEVATDDGSAGFHGLVTQLADERLRQGKSPSVVYGCGPTPMMQALGAVTARRRIPTQLALESFMGCALGVCLGCIVQVRDAGGAIQRVRVCTEGPVFDAAEIVW